MADRAVVEQDFLKMVIQHCRNIVLTWGV